MSGFKQYEPYVRFNAAKITPDEMDRYEQYYVIDPTTSATWVGTAAAGTNTEAKALVLINANLDYPRNLLYSVVGTNNVGGTWSINGKDQFGNVVTESVGSGTAAAGTPAFAVSGTKVFSQVTSGTFTFAVGSAGNGSARIGVAVGGTAGSTCYFGLPTKIAAVSDVKIIAWSKENVQTTLDGGTVSSTLVGTTNHTFNGTAALGGTEKFVVTLRPTFNNENSGNMANL
ncbi:MAG: hypothetical protein AAB922_06735 [Patescibacteria group bacterium]